MALADPDHPGKVSPVLPCCQQDSPAAFLFHTREGERTVEIKT